MKKSLVILLFLGFFASGTEGYSQEQTEVLSLTVQEAVDYALVHNESIKSAHYDLLAAEKSKWEAIAAGLPSVDGSLGFTDNLIIPTMVFNGMSFKVGTNYEASAGLSGSAVIFSAPYLMGVKAARLAEVMSQQGLSMTELDTKENVITAYYLILVTQETKKILEANLVNMNEILESTKAMYSVGMAESTDVDQMASTVSTLKNSLASMERTIEVNYNLLRFMLGLDRNAEITLKDSLDSIILAVNMNSLLNKEFKMDENLTYQLVKSQVEMSEISLRSSQSSVLPSIGLGYALNTSGRGNSIDSLVYANSSYVGLQVSVPIFASGLRHSRIQKAKINLNKAQTSQKMVEEQLLMQEKQLRYNLISSNEQYINQRENVDLASRILESTTNKYKQGMASSLDLTQTNNNYLVAQNNYLSALMTLLQNKIAFDKLMNIL